MSTERLVVVKQLPAQLTLGHTDSVLREIEPFLKGDRPRVVLDFSGVSRLDSTGIEMLVHCMEQAMKRNGDIKLAAIPSALAVILEITRVDRLFEIYENTSDAVESFERLPVHALRNRDDLYAAVAHAGKNVA